MKRNIIESAIVLFMFFISFGTAEWAMSQDVEAKESPLTELTFHQDLTEENWNTIRSTQHPFALSLYQTNVKDEDVKKLAGLSLLKSLNLGCCSNITDTALQYLAEVKSLNSLNLMNSRNLTDVGMGHLAKLTFIKELDLSYCPKITQDGVAYLKDLPHLKTLVLLHCKHLNRSVMNTLSKMTNLEVIFLNFVDSEPIDAEDFKSLGSLTNLKVLVLDRCSKITMKDVEKNLPLGKMRVLRLDDCEQISESDTERLKTAWPKCTIFIN